MNSRALVLCGAVGSFIVAAAVYAQQEDAMQPPTFVVMPHMKGQLAVQVSSIASLWYLPTSAEKSSQLRILSPAVTEAKTLSGPDADTLWAVLHEGATGASFVFVEHMGGILGIPRAQIRTAYYAEDTGTPRLRLIYDGDPSGKTLEGEHAARVWASIRPTQ